MPKKLHQLVKENLLFLITLFFAALVRFINFSERVNYGPEQAMTLITSAKYITEKVSLLGQMYLRETSGGYILFSGSSFNYFLSILELITKYDPIKITFFFGLLNLFTGSLLYFLVTKKFNKQIGLFSSIFFFFNTTMIYHSFFIWNYNFLPLLFLVSTYLFMSMSVKKNFIYITALSIICGIGISIQFLYAIPTFVFFLLVAVRLVNYRTLILFVFGILVGNLPMVLFDLRHDFYHFTTYYLYITEQLKGGDNFSFQYYHFIYLWPIFAVILSIFINKIYKWNKAVSIALLFLYVLLNLNSRFVDFKVALGMPKGLSAQDILTASSVIAHENEKRFNIVETYDFDSRAHVLRYPLMYIDKSDGLLGVTDYKDASAIFVLSEVDYDYNNPISWEINVFKPYTVRLVSKINENWGVFKLTK